MSSLLLRTRAIGRIFARSWRRFDAAVQMQLERMAPTEAQRLFALTLVIGAVCGLVAVSFHLAIRLASGMMIDRALRADGYSWIAWTVITPTLGGLVAGVLLRFFLPLARGSGVPQVKAAFALEQGRIRFRDAIGKFFIGAVQIGSGSSLGREGPTVHICAGTASLIARATSMSKKSQRRLMPVGVAAGIAAAFNAPIAAVTFTIEEVVGTLDHTVLSGVVVAAAFAAVVERSVLGTHPIFDVPQRYGLHDPTSLVLYALLGLVAGLVALSFTEGLLRLRLFFRDQRRIPLWAQPAVGGLVTGALAVLALSGWQARGVTGGGYDTLSLALGGRLTVVVMLGLCAMKIIATAFSYGSGGAGGIFAPALFVGGMLGGALGHLDVQLLHHPPDQVGAFSLVGMGAVFAAVIRAPITSVLIIFEMTGGYGLVLPLMIANMIAYGFARRIRPTPIYEALLEQDGIHVPHGVGAATRIIEHLQVASAMTVEPLTLAASMPVPLALEEAARHEFSAYPVVGDDGGFVGLVTIRQLRHAATNAKTANQAVGDLALAKEVVHPGEPLTRVAVLLHRKRVRQLGVVDPDDQRRLVGIVALSDIVKAQARATLEAEKAGEDAAAERQDVPR